LIKVYLLGL